MSTILRYFLFILVTLVLSSALAGDIIKGKAKAKLCAGCHGENGIGVSPIIPNLAAQKEAYLVSTLKEFKSGARKNGIMSPIATTMSDDDINDLSAYFSSLK